MSIKTKRPMKPFRGAMWNGFRWEGNAPRKHVRKVLSWMNRLASEDRPKKKKIPSKRQVQMRLYEHIKIAWRKKPENQVCQAYCRLHGKETRSTPNPHHKKGRAGDLLCDISFWLATFQACNDFIHAHPNLAYQRTFF